MHGQIKSPDPLFKLSQATEVNNAEASKKYAMKCVEQVSDTAYGDMFNKYLIQLYTGILNEPKKALVIVEREITNRGTPQIYCWLAWSLFANGEAEKAYEVYQKNISGKGLEALELYLMGKMMKGLDKGYNAQQFFKAADDNKYDLSPAMLSYLEKELKL